MLKIKIQWQQTKCMHIFLKPIHDWVYILLPLLLSSHCFEAKCLLYWSLQVQCLFSPRSFFLKHFFLWGGLLPRRGQSRDLWAPNTADSGPYQPYQPTKYQWSQSSLSSITQTTGLVRQTRLLKWKKGRENINLTFFYAVFLPILPTCCLLYTSPSPRDSWASRMPSSAW